MLTTTRTVQVATAALTWLLWATAVATAAAAVAVVKLDATWIAGSNATNQPALLTASWDARPGARAFHCSVTLTDGAFTLLYTYGGLSSAAVLLDDLWALDVDALRWRLLPNTSAIYPGPLQRHRCVAMPPLITGSPMSLALFGGASATTRKNTVWRYDAAGRQWLQLTVANMTGNVPLERANHAMAAHPTRPQLFVMGGTTALGTMNDMWQFTLTSATAGQWLLLSGNSSAARQLGVYGDIGVAADTNTPGSRSGPAIATVTVNGTTAQLLLFGGYGWSNDTQVAQGYLSDSWLFDLDQPASRQWWRWVGGRILRPLNVATQRNSSLPGQFTASAYPGARSGHWLENPMSTSQSQFAVLFAGRGFGQSAVGDFLNDFWVYDASTNLWAWIQGDDAASAGGFYGTLNVTTGNAYPPQRQFFGASVQCQAGNVSTLLVFGGKTGDNAADTHLNDVWRMRVTLPLPSPSITSSSNSYSSTAKSTTTIFSVTSAATKSSATSFSTSVSSGLLSSTASSSPSAPYSPSFSSSSVDSKNGPVLTIYTSRSSSSGIDLPTTTLLMSTSMESNDIPLPAETSTIVVDDVVTTKLTADDNTSATITDATDTSSVVASFEVTSESKGTVRQTTTLVLSTATPRSDASTTGASDGSISTVAMIVLVVALAAILLVLLIRAVFVRSYSVPRTQRLGFHGKHADLSRSNLGLMRAMADSNPYLDGGESQPHQASLKNQEIRMPKNNLEMAAISHPTVASIGEAGLNKTLLQATEEISVPGFLEMAVGKDFTVVSDDLVGRGAHGAVLPGILTSQEAIDRAGTPHCIVKRILFHKAPEKDAAAHQEEQWAFEQEVAMMYFLRKCRNIAELYGFCRSPAAIIMRNYELGTLLHLIFEQDRRHPLLKMIQYTNQVVISLAVDLLAGLEAMHAAGFAHLDVKPANVLLDDRGDPMASDCPVRAVLTDFGISRIVTNTTMLVAAFRKSKLAGASVAYAAPDLISSLIESNRSGVPDASTNLSAASSSTNNMPATTGRHSHHQHQQHDERQERQERLQKADCYAFGIVLFEMLTRRAAWGQADMTEVLDMLMQNQRPVWPQSLLSRAKADTTTAVLKHFVEQCWVAEARQRPDARTMRVAIARMAGG